jgi:argininosuccinate lyase
LSQDEDIHMAIERRLTELIGPLGGKLHTGRSRNDQVALDVRLYLRDQLPGLIEQLREFQLVLVAKAKTTRAVAMPGYTHLQRAQPVLFAHHLLAYVEMIERDKGRLRDARARLNVMPLGSGALAGTNYPVDRRYTAKLLGFPAITANSLDAVSDRDFMIEVAAGLSLAMMHLSRLSEELIVWSTFEFQFVELPDAFCTGSSMMPQKKNPDVPELIRGKTGRVYGQLVNLLVMLKGLPLSYNRDLQEDKPALFDALDTVMDSIRILTELMRRVKVNRDALKRAVQGGGLLATELADYLVAKGVPFREAHGITGRIVRTALEQKRELTDFSLEELRVFSERIEKGIFDRLTVPQRTSRWHGSCSSGAADQGTGAVAMNHGLAALVAAGVLASCGVVGPPVAPESIGVAPVIQRQKTQPQQEVMPPQPPKQADQPEEAETDQLLEEQAIDLPPLLPLDTR